MTTTVRGPGGASLTDWYIARGGHITAAEAATEMLTARRAFAADYGSDRVQIKAGERVRSDHPIARQYPQNFTRSATASTSKPKPKRDLLHNAPPDALPRSVLVVEDPRGLMPAGTPELRDGTPPCTVVIPNFIREDITAHINRVPRDYETGGQLLAHRDHDPSKVRLAEAWGPSAAAILKRHSVVLDWESDHHRVREASVRSDRAVIGAGSWHVHPGEVDPRPSDQDLAMFAAARADLDATVWPIRNYVGIIAGTPRNRLPRLTAWVVRETGRGLVCERAVIR